MESRLENYRLRKLTLFYFLEDRSIMITEPKQVNSGTPQGAFLKRQVVLKQDGSGMPFCPDDFRVGLDVGIFGRSIRVYDADQYTREFFLVSTNYLAEFLLAILSPTVAGTISRLTLFSSFSKIFIGFIFRIWESPNPTPLRCKQINLSSPRSLTSQRKTEK